MVSQALLDYVKKELARGVHEDKLRQTLLENDWPEFEINEAFEKVRQAEQVKPVEKPIEEKPPEKLLKETIPAEKPKESVKPKEPVLEEKSEEIKKISVIKNIQKIVTNKIFIIAVILVILGYVAFFILPSVFEESAGIEIASADVLEEAKKACTQYCNNNLCGLFTNPDFPQPELEGKNCLDLGIKCKQPDGKPKCEVEY